MKQISLDDISQLAPSGYYLAMRVGFAFPVEEVNCLPDDWVEHYTSNRLMMSDPILQWASSNVGFVRWSELQQRDARNILRQAQSFGMRYGVAVSVQNDASNDRRSYGYFARLDSEFTDVEAKLLLAFLKRRHLELAPPQNLTKAELEALKHLKDGMRLKEVAHTLGVTEGAIKQRIRNAKSKLGANTSSQAAAIAFQHGLI